MCFSEAFKAMRDTKREAGEAVYAPRRSEETCNIYPSTRGKCDTCSRKDCPWVNRRSVTERALRSFEVRTSFPPNQMRRVGKIGGFSLAPLPAPLDHSPRQRELYPQEMTSMCRAAESGALSCLARVSVFGLMLETRPPSDRGRQARWQIRTARSFKRTLKASTASSAFAAGS